MNTDKQIEAEARQLALCYMENINVNGQTTWSQMLTFTNKILELAAKKEDVCVASDKKILNKEQVKTAYQLLVGKGEEAMNEFLLASDSTTSDTCCDAPFKDNNSIEQ